MGQYFIVVNKTRREYLHPHAFGDGLKFLEFGLSSSGTLTGLAFLLRQSSSGGGGDIDPVDGITGRWIDNQITIVGDYDESGLYGEASESYKDISAAVIIAMAEADNYLASDLQNRTGFGDGSALDRARAQIA